MGLFDVFTFEHKGKCSLCDDVRKFTLADGLKWLANNDVKIICEKNVSLAAFLPSIVCSEGTTIETKADT